MKEDCLAGHIAVQKKATSCLQTRMDSYDHTCIPIYICCADTYEILFTNKVSKSLIGDVIGKKCYKSIRGSNCVCDDCVSNLHLKENGESVCSRGRYIPSMDKYFDAYETLIDWDDGRKVRLCQMLDTTKENKLALENKEKNATLELLMLFMNSADTMMTVRDLNNKPIFVNQCALQTTGYTMEEFAASGLDIMFPDHTLINTA